MIQKELLIALDILNYFANKDLANCPRKRQRHHIEIGYAVSVMFVVVVGMDLVLV